MIIFQWMILNNPDGMPIQKITFAEVMLSEDMYHAKQNNYRQRYTNHMGWLLSDIYDAKRLQLIWILCICL